MIAVEADDVIIDCQNHKLQMDEAFHRRQRFFSIIELGSKPFISSAGPPQFANGLLTTASMKSPKNVTIQNCKFGLSAHHGIHGNGPQGVVIRNMQIKDFEVGGIHLNGASDVLIENVDIGPSL